MASFHKIIYNVYNFMKFIFPLFKINSIKKFINIIIYGIKTIFLGKNINVDINYINLDILNFINFRKLNSIYFRRER